MNKTFESALFKIVFITSVFIFFTACAPASSNNAAPTPRTDLAGSWGDSSETFHFNLIGEAGGSLQIFYATGGACIYNVGITWTDPEGHDASAGLLSVADGTTLITQAGMLFCPPFDGDYTYAILVTGSLQICSATSGCKELGAK